MFKNVDEFLVVFCSILFFKVVVDIFNLLLAYPRSQILQ